MRNRSRSWIAGFAVVALTLGGVVPVIDAGPAPSAPAKASSDVTKAPPEAAKASPDVTKAPPPPTRSSPETGPTVININTAGVGDLMKLAGVGRKLAEKIVEYRDAHGPFKKPAEIRRVQGVGAGLWEKNRERIVVK